MRPMFENWLFPYLEKRSGHKLYSRVLRIFGRGEADVEYCLKDLMESSNPSLAPYAKRGEVTLRLTAFCKDEAEGEALLAPLIRQIETRIGKEFIYSENDRMLHEVCAQMLLEKKMSLAVAESCTGGMLTSRFVDLPGCSAFLKEACVTYSNEAKMQRLGVREETLREFGAVSAQTAAEMAEGIRRTSGASLGLATTGIAGPDGGTPEKPVGLVYIAAADAKGTSVKELRLWGDRENVRNLACLNACDLLRKKLFSDCIESGLSDFASAKL